MSARRVVIGLGLVSILAVLLACSQVMDRAKNVIGGNGKDSERGGQPQESSASQSQPASQQSRGGPPSGGYGSRAYGAGNPYGGNCMTSASTRQETSDCWRGMGDSAKQTAQQCRNRADSGMYDKDKANLQKCATDGMNASNAFYCVADDILKSGAQMEQVVNACMDKYHMRK